MNLKIKESDIHNQVVKYLKLRYPKAVFNTDMAGLVMSKLQGMRAAALRSSNGFPDIVIYAPRGGYHGLFIELKTDKTKILKKSGQVYEKFQHQYSMHMKLKSLGYFVEFACGFDAAKELIDKYFKIM